MFIKLKPSNFIYLSKIWKNVLKLSETATITFEVIY